MVGGKLEDWRGVKEGVHKKTLAGVTLGCYGTHKKHRHLFSASRDWKGKIREFGITETGGEFRLMIMQHFVWQVLLFFGIDSLFCAVYCDVRH